MFVLKKDIIIKFFLKRMNLNARTIHQRESVETKLHKSSPKLVWYQSISRQIQL